MKKQILAAAFACASFTSFGAGYQLNLQGLRQVAMGGTGTAWPWDASTIFYNPGGLSRLKNIQAYVSTCNIYPVTAYGNVIGSERSRDQIFRPINLYVGGTVKKDSKLGLGLGIYTPFGNGLQWDNSWTGRYIVQSVDLSTIFIQPTASYRFTDFLSVGGGFIYASGNLNYRKALPVQDINGNDASAQLSGSASGVGFNLGVHMKISDRVQAGITYRSQVNMDMGSGAATFNVPASLKSSFPNTRFDAQLPLPQVLSVGVGFKPLNNEKLTMQFDLNYTGWNSFDSLRFNFATHTSSLQDIRAPRLYRNTITARLGANYKLGKVVSVMGGAAYDQTPVTDGNVSPDLPDANHYIVSCGASIKPMSRFTILAALEYNTTVKRAGSYDFGNFNGTFQTHVVVPGIGIYYNF
jgi:long-chain fatty acid transport protein